jgi:hypothetical protein
LDLYWLKQSVDTAQALDQAKDRIDELEDFVDKLKDLLVYHDVICCTNGNRYASVNPKKIQELLKEVDNDETDQ